MSKGPRSTHAIKDAVPAQPAAAAAAHAPFAEASAHEDMRQYVTFRVDDATWGVPLAEVQEITRMPDVVRVPRSPKSLAGLANLRGTVLPVADLRRLMRVADAPPSDDARVVVLDRAFPIGFKVDGTASLVNVPVSRIEPPDQVGSGIDHTMLRGLFRGVGGAGTTRIIDPDALLRRDFGQRRSSNGASARRQTGPAAVPAAVPQGPAANADALVLVSFLNEQREKGLAVREAVIRGTALRMRPVMMTASVAILGLVPMLLSSGVGAETQRPLATVVVGGLISSTLLTLVLLPVLYDWIEGRASRRPDHGGTGAGSPILEASSGIKG